MNEITIGDPSLGQNIDDDFITTKIKSKLTLDGDINPFNIDVDTKNGIVTLSGRVAKPEAKQNWGCPCSPFMACAPMCGP